eukprot:717773-Amphidinium_carterae.1
MKSRHASCESGSSVIQRESNGCSYESLGPPNYSPSDGHDSAVNVSTLIVPFTDQCIGSGLISCHCASCHWSQPKRKTQIGNEKVKASMEMSSEQNQNVPAASLQIINT